MWTCPEGSPTIWRQQLCDNFFNCRRSLGDEKICVDYGPHGCSNITFIDEKAPVGHLAAPAVPRIYVPNFDCSAPLCVDKESETDLVYKAHLLCRQTGRFTFQRLALVTNDESRWPIVLSPAAVRCSGHETTIQECSRLTSMRSSSFFINNCSRVFAVACAKECAKEIVIDDPANEVNIDPTKFAQGDEIYLAPPQGKLVSPGYPNYFLPNLDCTWTLTVPDKRQIFLLNVTVLNLQEFDLEIEDDDGDKIACTNSYVEIGLGSSKKDGVYRLCKENAVGMSFKSVGNRIFVRYISGQYKGSVLGDKGFAIMYSTADSGFDPDAEPLSLTNISLIAFASVIGFLCVVLGVLFIFNKSKVKQFTRKRRSDMVTRLQRNNALPLLRAPNSKGHFKPPVICSICGQHIKHVDDLCAHYGRLLEYVTNFVYNPRPKKNEPLRLRNKSQTSNITVDMDELLKANYTLRKQQERWRSMDVSCIDSISLRTAQPCDSSVHTSYTAEQDDSDEDAFRSPSPRLSPRIVAKNAASSVKHFLTTAVISRLSFSSWRTPSPKKSPIRHQIPKITIETDDAGPIPVILTKYKLSPRSRSLTVPPAGYRSA